MTKLANHDIFEIWNEDVAESVYFLGRPTAIQVEELVRREWWRNRICGDATMTVKQYIKECVKVEKLKHVFCESAAHYQFERGED